MKKFALLIVLLMVGSFVACTSAEEGAQTQPAVEAGQVATADEVADDGRMFAETFPIRWLEVGRPYLYDDDNMVEQRINEMLNVEIEYIQIPNVEFAERLGIILASRDLPDVINFQNMLQVSEWASQGAIIQLDDLLQSYGHNIQAQLTEEDIIQGRSATDGNLWAIRGIQAVEGAFTVMFREDWLENLGLPVPRYLHEWREVLEAVRDGDPRGDGSADVIPFTGQLRAFENAFGIQSTWWQMYDDQFINRVDHPNYIEWLEWMIEFYNDGLLDPEWFIRIDVMADIEEPFFADRAFMKEQWAAFGQTATEALQEVNPNARMVAVDPIVGPYGHQQIMDRSRWVVPTSISSQSSRPADVMRVIDWFYSYDGIMLTNFGVEGVTFEYVEGLPQLLPDFASFPDSRRVGINKSVGPLYMLQSYFIQAMLGGQTPDEISPEMFVFYDGLTRNQPFLYRPAQTITTPAFTRDWANMEVVLRDSEVQTIIGNQTLEAHIRTIETQRADGMDEITREKNEALAILRGN